MRDPFDEHGMVEPIELDAMRNVSSLLSDLAAAKVENAKLREQAAIMRKTLEWYGNDEHHKRHQLLTFPVSHIPSDVIYDAGSRARLALEQVKEK